MVLFCKYTRRCWRIYYSPSIAGGFPAGSVTFTITDQNGCTLQIYAFVDPDPIISSIEPDNLYFGPYDVL